MAKIIRPAKKKAKGVAGRATSTEKQASRPLTAAAGGRGGEEATPQTAAGDVGMGGSQEDASGADDDDDASMDEPDGDADAASSAVESGSSYLRHSLLAFGALHDPLQNAHGVNVQRIRTKMKESGFALDHPQRVLQTMHHLVNDGLLERKQSNYSLSEAGQARVAAIKESLNAYGDNVAHSDERIWIQIAQYVHVLETVTPPVSPAPIKRTRSFTSGAAQPTLLSRISLKRASSDDDTDDNTEKARTDDQADDDEEIDDAMPSAEADDEETTIKVLKQRVARLETENVRLKQERLSRRLSGYSSSSSLSSAPEAVAIVAEDAGQTLQDDLITGASKEKVAAGNEQVAAGLSTTLTPKRVEMAAAGGDLSTATTFEAAGLSRNETAACGGPSSSQADFMPSSPTVGVRSRMLARAQPLESRHSQQHTPSPSPPLAGGDDADRTAVGPSRAALEAQVADLLTTLNKALTTNDDLIQQIDGLVEQEATLKERIASLTAEGSASRVQGRMPSDESGADVGHLEQMNEATRTAIASVTQERDAVRVSLASKDADVSAASKDVATLMAKVAHLERERASAASAWEAEKGTVQALRKQLEDLSAELQLTQLSRLAVIADLDEKTAECASLFAASVSQAAQHMSAEAIKSQLEALVELHKDDCARLAADNAAQGKALRDKQRSVETLTGERNKFQQSVQLLESAVAALTDERDALQLARQVKTDSCDAVKQQLEDTQQQLADALSVQVTTQAAADAARERAAALDGDVARASAESQTLEGRLSIVQLRLEETSRQRDLLTAELGHKKDLESNGLREGLLQIMTIVERLAGSAADDGPITAAAST